MLPIIIAIIVAAAAGSAVAGVYNSLVTHRNRVDDAWQGLEALMRRHVELVPGLLGALEGRDGIDPDALEAVAGAQEDLARAAAPADEVAADDALAAGVRGLFAVVDEKPDLGTGTWFKRVRDEVEGAEDRIACARMAYDDSVRSYNEAISTFPGSMFAGIFQFKELPALDAFSKR